MAESTSRELPSASFSSFVISLAQSALVHMGESPDPSTGDRTTQLVLARHSIDVLGVLEEKTKGNLDEEEQKLLASVLYELRSKFVEVSRRQQG